MKKIIILLCFFAFVGTGASAMDGSRESTELTQKKKYKKRHHHHHRPRHRPRLPHRPRPH